MKTRLSVIICVQVGEIVNGMTQNGLIVFHFRQIQKLDRLKKKVELSQHQRLEDERKYSDNRSIVWKEREQKTLLRKAPE